VQIAWNEITKETTECIVNAANETLTQGGGVCNAIFKAAGEDRMALACKKIMAKRNYADCSHLYTNDK
jgi:O-acetyl-ADP-ribose deacetylase (regulator of RNase III)